LEAPKTKSVAGLFSTMNIEGRKIVLVLGEHNENLFKSCRNIPRVTVLSHAALNVYDLAGSEVVVLTEGALSGITEAYGS
jgi:large subunit ribosomal protein L4